MNPNYENIAYRELDRQKGLDPLNRGYLEAYLHDLELRQLRDTTLRHKLWRVFPLLQRLQFKDLKQITRMELEEYIIYRKRNKSPITVQGDILELKLFFRWLVPDRYPDLFQNIRMKRTNRKLPVEYLLVKDDIRKLVKACDNQRDRALIMLLWDSGARISEVLSRNVGHVEIDKYGAVVIVDGKTGRRRLRLIDGVPDLQLWLQMHPYRSEPSAPLFLTNTRYGVGRKRLNLRTVENRLKYLKKKLNIVKPTNPHAIRHGRLTDLAKQGFSEMELRLIAGWEKSSAMPEVYVHLSGGDIERKMLQKAGFVEGDFKEDQSLTPKDCPRCGTRNSWDGIYCSKCSMVLDSKSALMIDESVAVAKESSEYENILAALRKDLGISH
ncbi:MAG TPA: tyrosine-type recombinase/integrase [Methanoregulaceae archaeon]|nr:tyrosine-type recombinase/integrase [Methanoregulaceae archaeon]